jgi:hypothetical protein
MTSFTGSDPEFPVEAAEVDERVPSSVVADDLADQADLIEQAMPALTDEDDDYPHDGT